MTGDIDIWLALQSVPGLGPSKLKALCETFKPVSKLKELRCEDICAMDGVGEGLARSISEKLQSLDGTASPLDIPDGVGYIAISESGYPKRLFNIYDPPTVLYHKGNIIKDDESAVAVVGTRNPSRYGLLAAERITKDLVEAGFTIVSGLAAGIDSCAHETALRCGGRTIAVLASGLEDIYPSFNKGLSEDIINRGALVSELCRAPLKYEKWAFPKRNRIISGLSLGTVVIEGALNSGSLITAGFAVEQNREVFAVPGEIFSRQSAGPNSLIKSGAKLVHTVEDILEELPGGPRRKRGALSLEHLSEEEKKVIGLLSSGPRGIDLICEDTGIPLPRLSSVLLSMQLAGSVRELPGRTFGAL